MNGVPLIFGAAGFVGRNLMNSLKSSGPIGYDKDDKDDWDDDDTNKPYIFYNLDIYDMDETQLPDQPFYVINLMAELGSPSEQDNIRNNLESVSALYALINKKKQYCLGVIHFSSISAAREISFYGKTKKSSELIVVNGGIPYVILQSEMIIGDGARSIEKLKKALNLFPLVSFMPRGGEVIRYPIKISEVCELVCVIMEKNFFPNKTYHMLSSKITMRELAEKYTDNIIIKIPQFSLLLLAKILEKMFKKPLFTYDNAVGVCSDTELTLDILTPKVINDETA